MGAYCRYCDRRCFLPRTLPADAKDEYAGMTIHMATCAPGMEHDRKVTGYDHTTAINPVTLLVGGARMNRAQHLEDAHDLLLWSQTKDVSDLQKLLWAVQSAAHFLAVQSTPEPAGPRQRSELPPRPQAITHDVMDESIRSARLNGTAGHHHGPSLVADWSTARGGETFVRVMLRVMTQRQSSGIAFLVDGAIKHHAIASITELRDDLTEVLDALVGNAGSSSAGERDRLRNVWNLVQTVQHAVLQLNEGTDMPARWRQHRNVIERAITQIEALIAAGP